MKKTLAVVLAALAFSSVLFAAEGIGEKKDGKLKKIKLSSNEVIMVGSASVVVDDKNFEFYAKTWGVTDFDKEDSYIVYGDSYEEYATVFFGSIKKKNNGKFGSYAPGECFLSKQSVKKGVLTSVWPIKWRFYSDPNFEIYLPFNFEANVPKGEKFVYVGHFEYHLEGSDFRPVKINVSDRYDQAKESLERLFGEEVELCRVEIREQKEN